MVLAKATGCDLESKPFMVGFEVVLAEVDAVLDTPGEPNVFAGVPNGVVEEAGSWPLEGAPNGVVLCRLVKGFEVAAVLEGPVELNVFVGVPKGVVEKAGS
jgi:hypothetical protein